MARLSATLPVQYADLRATSCTVYSCVRTHILKKIKEAALVVVLVDFASSFVVFDGCSIATRWLASVEDGR